MLKVILNHWQNQRQRPQSSLPILTPSDEEAVTKVNPIFADEQPSSSSGSDEPLPSLEERQPPVDQVIPVPSPPKPPPAVPKLPRVVFSTSGFDSLDSRDDPVGAFVTDVVAEVHRPDSTSLPRTLAPNTDDDGPSLVSDDPSSAVDHRDAIKDADPTEYFNQTRKTSSGQPSFLHYSYNKQLSVLKRKDKEPRTSIFNFNAPSSASASNDAKPKDTTAPPVNDVRDVKAGTSKEEHDLDNVPSTQESPSTTNPLTETPTENTYSELKKAESSKNDSSDFLTNSADKQSTSVPPPPPPLPQISKVDKATYTRIESVIPITSTVLTNTAAKLGNDVKKPKAFSHAEILKQAMMSNNNNLKPSEIAKRERELRAAAARERGDILPTKTPSPVAATTTTAATPVENGPKTPPKIVPKRNAQTNFKKPPQMTFPKPPPVEESQEGNGAAGRETSRLDSTANDRPPPEEEISVSAAKPNENTEVKKPFEVRAYSETRKTNQTETEVKKIETKSVRSNSITRAENSQEVENKRDSKPKSTTPPKNMPCRKCDRLHDPTEPCPEPTVAATKPKKGVTRGDQIGLDESSGHTSGSASSGPGPSKHRSDGDGGRENWERRPRSPRLCPHCYMHGRRSVRMKRPPELSKYDDYYLSAIRGGSRAHRMSADSLSDFSTDPYDRHLHPWVGRKYRSKRHGHPERPFSRQSRGGFRSPAEGRYPPEGATLGSDEFDEEYLDKFPYLKRRRFSWGSCSCDQCSEASSFTFERRPKSFGEADDDKVKSNKNKAPFHHPNFCTCGHSAQNGRRVKFEEKGGGGNANKDGGGGGDNKEDPDPKQGTSKDEEDGEEITKDKDQEKNETEKEGEAKKSDKAAPEKNGRPKGILNGGYPQYPWEIEDWEMYMQKRYVMRKRRRALYMGIVALVIIVIVGMTVGLVMVWLRKTAPSH